MGPCLSETELISRFFNFDIPNHWPTQGIGDDCAIMQVGASRIAVTTDTLACGTHFLPDVNPYTVGRKSLAVNLSDLAAAGARPRCFFLALSLPETNLEWLEAFSRGLFEMAREYDCPLIGGDTTKTAKVGNLQAPFSLTITAMGEVKKGLTRAGAKVGDDIWVSGTPGDAYLALMLRTGEWSGVCSAHAARAMDNPTPRVALGQFLEGRASACADISDGFLKDLGNILSRSNVGARINVDALAASDDLNSRPLEQKRMAQLAGGDDYELVWTAPVCMRAEISAYAKQCPALCFSRVGEVTPSGLMLFDDKGREVKNIYHGFDHFSQ